MNQKKEGLIIVTGAAGFIGSCMAGGLNQAGFNNLVLVDDFSREEKRNNISAKEFVQKVERDEFVAWLEDHHDEVSFIIHFGVRTDTTEFDVNIFNTLNLNYTKALWKLAAEHNIPLIYASSAATYGMGELGYDDRHDIVDQLQPLNPYGRSKNDFDRWAVKQESTPPFWAGLKFFNVYGPNEYHKGRMASVIFHAYRQIKENGLVKLFRSHHPDYKDGEQLRDFIYVRDVVNVSLWLMQHMPESGLYNLGTGKASTFRDLVAATFKAVDKEEHIQFIDTPEDIRDKYQYFTEANMDKLRDAGYDSDFYSLEEGVEDYVRNYLSQVRYF